MVAIIPGHGRDWRVMTTKFRSGILSAFSWVKSSCAVRYQEPATEPAWGMITVQGVSCRMSLQLNLNHRITRVQSIKLVGHVKSSSPARHYFLEVHRGAVGGIGPASHAPRLIDPGTTNKNTHVDLSELPVRNQPRQESIETQVLLKPVVRDSMTHMNAIITSTSGLTNKGHHYQQNTTLFHHRSHELGLYSPLMKGKNSTFCPKVLCFCLILISEWSL